MLFALPSPDTLYAALCARDPAYDGRVFVGVTSTGIFCRLTCPARNPKRENCVFHETAAECLDAGFRPCQRCHPMAAGGAGPEMRKLLGAMQADPARIWREADLAGMGLDPSTMRRAFRRVFGMTFLELARLRRLGLGFKAMARGGSVIDAQLSAGYDSPSAFRAAFHKLVGMAPGAMATQPRLLADWLDTALGPMIAVADSRALHLLEFADRKALPAELGRLAKAAKGSFGLGSTPPIRQVTAELQSYFAGQSGEFSTPIHLSGTPFQRAVWRALRKIKVGQTWSYSELARAIGRPGAVRAVGAANGANQIAILLPCHRVIGANGALTGYGGGLWRKEKLLELERRLAAKGASKGVKND